MSVLRMLLDKFLESPRKFTEDVASETAILAVVSVHAAVLVAGGLTLLVSVPVALVVDKALKVIEGR